MVAIHGYASTLGFHCDSIPALKAAEKKPKRKWLKSDHKKRCKKECSPFLEAKVTKEIHLEKTKEGS